MSVTFLRRNLDNIEPKKGYWDNQDIADFYRAVELLKQAGLNTEVDSGVTDEGDPWFVFMKPETGDVIAHFAQIDGCFIAVSSLNQEVYKGSDIRSIVDQMLDRHPLLLPQSKNSGRLMLHPTAALSAFLAAAFILAIDGVKASSLTDVLVGVISEERDIAANNDVQPAPYGQRYETMKGMFSELNLVNYNAAVLGAALISRNLSHNELEIKSDSVEEDSSIVLNNSEKEETEFKDLNFNINLENDRGSSEADVAAYSTESKNLNINDEEGETGHSGDKFDIGDKSQGGTGKAGFNQAASENGAVFAKEYQVFWTNGDMNLKNNYQLIHQVKKNNLNEQFDTTKEPEFILGDELPGPNLAVVLENLQESFQIVPLSLRSEAVGVTFNPSGELRLTSLNPFKEKSFGGEPVKDVILPTEQLKPMAGPIDSRENSDGFYAPVENDNNEASQVEQIAYRKPIIGHSLSKKNDTLLLTDAIDVVFYDGGDSEISGFELGTDLLWFFLSAEELEAANNSVNSNGDLVLDFGDTGTLTFLGMVSDTFVDGIA